ncbi:MAG: type I DNA topoisomerase [Thermaceae bacterium]
MLGRGFEVRASKGHVADLPERGLGVDVENGFTPTYVVKKEKKQVVEELKKAAQGKRVLIATDPDREGEAIGWHLARLLGLDPKEPLRVEFHEITPAVVQKAVQAPRPIDQNLVDAQQARRVLDRLLGYNLSPLLSIAFRKRALSAGRVQSVALRLVVEREEEIESFRPEVYHLIHGTFLLNTPPPIPARLYQVEGKRLWLGEGEKEGKLHLKGEAEVQALLLALKEATYRVEKVETTERRRSPPPPFTTSTLQQLASSRLGYTASRTMRIAQRLYEGVDLPEGTVGLITYMRTDSVRVSPLAVGKAREVIREVFGEAYLSKTPRAYANRKGQVQDAHEAIRPTDPARRPELVRPYLSEEEYQLYDLIWRRFIASQMAEALYETTSILFTSADGRFVFRAAGSVQKFEGYLKVWGRDTASAGNLPDAHPGHAEAYLGEPSLDIPFLIVESLVGSPAQLNEVFAEKKATEPPPRYTDASLVKTLEELGIGRPSTYAPTLETLEKRAYVERQGRTLKPTPLGREVVHYLKRYFPKVVAYDFTAQMESRLDEVEEGRAVWPRVVQEFYAPFLEELAQAPKKTCPLCGRPLELKVSRFGQFLGCTGYPECTYTEPLEKRESEPLEETCPKCGRPLLRKTGRYGTFIACSGYPDCDYTRDEAPSTGLTCPKCKKGRIIKKQSRRGKPYYRCSEKDCDFLSFYPLLEETCPLCGWNLVQKGQAKGCSNPDCPDYIGARGKDREAPLAFEVSTERGGKGRP